MADEDDDLLAQLEAAVLTNPAAAAASKPSPPPATLSLAMILKTNPPLPTATSSSSKSSAPPTDDEVADSLIDSKVLHLEYLNLHSRGLDSLHPFTNLKELYLMGNRLTSVDDALEFCPNLTTLFLRSNQISNLCPPNPSDPSAPYTCFKSLTRLRVLDVSNNLIVLPLAGGRSTYTAVFPRSLNILDLSSSAASSPPPPPHLQHVPRR